MRGKPGRSRGHKPVSSARPVLGRLAFETAPGLFSADRVDDGTRLLLAHLPSSTPAAILDLGCGYGALGLPIAAERPDARALLVDRDLLAVEYARRNARSFGLRNVECRGSLGYRDVGPGPWDWILCNVPARIGRDAIAAFASGGAARLSPGGELRFVVIRDLGPVVEEVVATLGLDGRQTAAGPRHLIYAIAPRPGPTEDRDDIYLRDRVAVGGLELERPADISEDPGHQREGLPLLLSVLPSRPGARALVWRGSYGAATATLARRGASVVAADRDLLALAFTQRNTARLGVAVEARGAATAAELAGSPAFDTIAAEAQPAFGEEGTRDEWRALAALVRPGGDAVVLGPARLLKATLRLCAAEGHALVADHAGWAVARLRSAR